MEKELFNLLENYKHYKGIDGVGATFDFNDFLDWLQSRSDLWKK